MQYNSTGYTREYNNSIGYIGKYSWEIHAEFLWTTNTETT
jgi:hypothetical protein